MRDIWNEHREVWVKSNKSRSGRPRKITPEIEEEMKKFIDANPDAYIKDITYFLNARYDIDVDEATVWRAVHRRGWLTEKPKKPRNSDPNQSRGFWIPGTNEGDEPTITQWREPGKRQRTERKPPSEKKIRLNANDKLLDKTRDYVRYHQNSQRFDASHDAGHVERVEQLALHILRHEQQEHPDILYDPILLQMAALTHDVEDVKYAPSYQYVDNQPDEQASKEQPPDSPPPPPQDPEAEEYPGIAQLQNYAAATTPQPPTYPETPQPQSYPWPSSMPRPASIAEQTTPTPSSQTGKAEPPLTPQQAALVQHLKAVSCPPHLRHMLTRLIPLISHTHSLAHPEHVAQIRQSHPELPIVQDADKLDALGAIGVARTFLFAGARKRSVEDTFAHFDEKLERLPETMNTKEGRRIAEVRVRRLQAFREAWVEEAGGFDYSDQGHPLPHQTVGEEGDVTMRGDEWSEQQGQMVPPQGYGPQQSEERMVNGGENGNGIGLGVHVAPAPAPASTLGGSGSAPPARMQARMENDPGVQLMEEMYGGLR